MSIFFDLANGLNFQYPRLARNLLSKDMDYIWLWSVFSSLKELQKQILIVWLHVEFLWMLDSMLNFFLDFFVQSCVFCFIALFRFYFHVSNIHLYVCLYLFKLTPHMGLQLINDILSRNCLPVIVGGTNYYIQVENCFILSVTSTFCYFYCK